LGGTINYEYYWCKNKNYQQNMQSNLLQSKFMEYQKKNTLLGTIQDIGHDIEQMLCYS